MNPEPQPEVGYTAREEYLAEAVVRDYIPHRFSGRLGRYRYRREQDAINRLLEQVPRDTVKSVLDCPTGIGRWLPNLATLQPSRIVGVDVSPTMLAYARTVDLSDAISTEFREGVAEDLPFQTGEFDLVFCHALLKHLPETAQFDVIKEVSRVTKSHAIITTSVLRGAAGMVRLLREAGGAVAVTPSWFDDATQHSGLRIVDSQKVATPLGVEFSYLMRRT